MVKKLIILIVVIIFLGTLSVKAQSDTLHKSNFRMIMEMDHSPMKATLASAILPGLGQAYNRKYWKIPLIYTAVGGAIFFINFNTERYNLYSDGFAYHDTPGPYSPYPNKLYLDPITQAKPSADVLKKYKKRYKRNHDLGYIVIGAVYLLNIIDAVVDAHMYNYDVTKELSFNFEPTCFPLITSQQDLGAIMGFGLRCNIKLH